jgi:hypothetical protein
MTYRPTQAFGVRQAFYYLQMLLYPLFEPYPVIVYAGAKASLSPGLRTTGGSYADNTSGASSTIGYRLRCQSVFRILREQGADAGSLLGYVNGS